jgi:hypothetical protein
MKTLVSIVTLPVVASLVGCAIVPITPAPSHYVHVYPHAYAAPHDGYHGHDSSYRYYDGYRH